MASIINRRQLLRSSALAGISAFLYPWEAAASGLSIITAPTLPNVSDLIRLGSNENPYGPSQSALDAMQATFSVASRYPWASHAPLIDALAKKHGVTQDHIVLCAGSNEGLRATAAVYGGPGQEIIAAQPTYLALMVYAEQFSTYIHYVPLDKDLQHDLEEMAKRITKRTSLVFICNPNNPTGSLLSAKKIQSFCNAISDQTIVFSDEAYYDYIKDKEYPSMVELVKQGKNVIVSRTFSKVYGLAGVRAGYLIARPDIASRIKGAIMANMSALATAAALASIRDQAFYKFSLQKNEQAVQRLEKIFDEMKLEYLPSHANFVFVKTGKDIRMLNQEMKAEGVLVGRPFPPFNDWCRVSTGSLEELNAFETTFRKVMKS